MVFFPPPHCYNVDKTGQSDHPLTGFNRYNTDGRTPSKFQGCMPRSIKISDSGNELLHALPLSEYGCF